MKVKITYTVDLEDIPLEVNNLYSKAKSYIQEAEGIWPPEVTDENLTEHLNAVDELRKKLFHVDLILADVDGILRSYMETKFSQKQKEDSKELLNG